MDGISRDDELAEQELEALALEALDSRRVEALGRKTAKLIERTQKTGARGLAAFQSNRRLNASAMTMPYLADVTNLETTCGG